MDLRTLLIRNIAYHWRSHIAVVLGVAASATVLIGALLIGDSVRGSLKDLNHERLGRVDHAVVGDHFFREMLAADMEAHSTRKFAGSARLEKAVPAILLRGGIAHAASGARASQINVIGIDERFYPLMHRHTQQLPPIDAWSGEKTVLNETVAHEIGAKAGDAVLLQFEKPSSVPRESSLGRRSDVVATVRLTVAQVIPTQGVGRFGLQPDRRGGQPLNVFVPMKTLQRALHLEGRANAIFISGGSEQDSLQGRVQNVLTPDDVELDLRVPPKQTYVSVESRRMLLEPAVAAAALKLAQDLNQSASPVLTYLANTIAISDRQTPYSTVTAWDPEVQALKDESPFLPLRLLSTEPAPPLKDDEILLNEWAANDLLAKPGDAVRLTYYSVAPGGELQTSEHTFKLAGIVLMRGAANDPNLTPSFPGISEARTMGDWDPPFPVDLKRVRPKDEDYWRDYRATPKAFVSLSTGQSLWTSRFGNVTSIRLGRLPGLSLEKTAEQFGSKLMARLQPEQVGITVLPVKKIAVRAAEGSTDFSELFLYFSFFLIAAAMLLVALLLRLAVERRNREIGALIAQGFPQRDVRSLLVREFLGVAVIGGAIGIAGAIGYGELMLAGLRKWLLPGASSFLTLHISTETLGIGFVASIAVAWVAIRWAAGILQRISPAGLLAGQLCKEVSSAKAFKRNRRRFLVPALVALGSAAILGYSAMEGGEENAENFLMGGAGLLVAGLMFFSAWLKSEAIVFVLKSKHSSITAILRLGIRNASRHPVRSVMTAGLVAFATFVIIAVGANRQETPNRPPQKDSGDGGFALVAHSDVPLHQNLNSAQGRDALGISNNLLTDVVVTSLRLRPGDDASCLNLYAPQRPRILGAPEAMLKRGGFRFRSSLAESADEKKNPWLLLQRDYGKGVVPVAGDYNTVKWILQHDLGDEITVTDDLGATVHLKFVALLQDSIFQGELITSEQHFLKMFPSQSGYGIFLIEAPAQRADQVGQKLEQALAEYGFDATKTSEVLAAYGAVSNTYLSTFQFLGGLGLILGTLGLGAVLLRNVLERQGELALLQALGFRKSSLALLVLAENGFLLVFGLACGVGAALLAVAPNVVAMGVEHVPWGQLGALVGIVFVTGMTSGVIAAKQAMRMPVLSALREEH